MVKYEDFTVGDIQSHSQWNVCRGQVQSVKPEERNRAEPTSRSRHVTNTFSFCHQTWTHRVLNDEQERSTWGDGNHTVGLWTRHNSELNQRQHSPVGGTSGGRTGTLGFCGAVEAGPCGQTVYWWRTPGPEGREEPGSQHTEPESGAPEPPSEEEENNVRTTDEIELGFIFYWILTGSKCGLRPSSCPRDNMVENGPRFFINHSVLELDPFTQPGPGVWWNEQKIFWLNDETDVKAALWLVGPAQTWLRFGQEGEQEVLQHHAPLFQTHSLKVVDEHLQPGYNDEKKNPEWENILELSVEVKFSSLSYRRWILVTYTCWYDWQLKFLSVKQPRKLADADGRNKLRRPENQVPMAVLFISCSSVNIDSLICAITSRTTVADGTTVVVGCGMRQLCHTNEI